MHDITDARLVTTGERIVCATLDGFDQVEGQVARAGLREIFSR